MKCWSRSTLGVVIGSLNVLTYLACIIYAIIFLVTLNSTENPNQEQKHAISLFNKVCSVVLVLCVAMACISGMFIRGIVKRRHKLMMPWLIISGIGFILQCVQFLFGFIGSIFQGYPFGTILIVLVVGLLGIGISALILWPIFTLFGDIRKENVEQPVRITSGQQASPSIYYTKA